MNKKIVIVILALIWIIVIGTLLKSLFGIDEYDKFIYESTPEIEEFNSIFYSYEGKMIGSQVKALLTRLIANADTYIENPDKIPWVSYNSNKSNEDSNLDLSGTFCCVVEKSKNEQYLKYLSIIKNNIDLKKEYNVSIIQKPDGYIGGITINYDSLERINNFEIDKKTKVLKAIKGVIMVDLDSLDEILTIDEQ